MVDKFPDSSGEGHAEAETGRQDVVFEPEQYRKYFDDTHFAIFCQKVYDYIHGISQPQNYEPEYIDLFRLGKAQAEGVPQLDSIEGLRAHYSGQIESESVAALGKIDKFKQSAQISLEDAFSDKQGSETDLKNGTEALDKVVDYANDQVQDRYHQLSNLVIDELNSPQLDGTVRGLQERNVANTLDQAFHARQEYPSKDLHKDIVEPWRASQQKLIDTIDGLLVPYEDYHSSHIKKLVDDSKGSLFGFEAHMLNGGYRHGPWASLDRPQERPVNANGYSIPHYLTKARQAPIDGEAWSKELIERCVDATIYGFGYDYGQEYSGDFSRQMASSVRARRRRRIDGTQNITLPQTDMDFIKGLFEDTLTGVADK